MNARTEILGSARVPRGGERVPAIADSSSMFTTSDVLIHRQSSFRRDSETSTRDACAPQI
jgi:hypothetical protein